MTLSSKLDVGTVYNELEGGVQSGVFWFSPFIMFK